MTLTLDHDRLVRRLEDWRSAEAGRASSAAETREEIGAYLEENSGLHKKALAWIRQIYRMEPDKRADVLRSLDALMDSLRPMWDGQKDLFDQEQAQSQSEAPEPVPFKALEFPGKGSTKGRGRKKAEPEPDAGGDELPAWDDGWGPKVAE